jgi:spore germination cell wall hydrolase CwlJ-like protein
MKLKRGTKEAFGMILIPDIIIIISIVTIILSIFRMSEKMLESKNKEVNAQNNIIVKECNIPECEFFPELHSSKSANKYSSIFEEEKYLIAKIVMCEAGNQSDETKEMVAEVVLNRVKSELFPDEVKDVIFQKSNGVYQFTPVSNGFWEKYEPDESCFNAVNLALYSECSYSKGALYFESNENADNWHSRNLEFICKSDDIRFYK